MNNGKKQIKKKYITIYAHKYVWPNMPIQEYITKLEETQKEMRKEGWENIWITEKEVCQMLRCPITTVVGSKVVEVKKTPTTS